MSGPLCELAPFRMRLDSGCYLSYKLICCQFRRQTFLNDGALRLLFLIYDTKNISCDFVIEIAKFMLRYVHKKSNNAFEVLD